MVNKVNPVRKLVGNFKPLSNRFRCFFAFTTIQRDLLSNGVRTFRSAQKRRGDKLSQTPFVFCLLFVGFLYLFAATETEGAKTYYLDIEGVGQDGIKGTSDDTVPSDSNPGTSAQPWKALNRAYTWYGGAGPKVQEGDTVLFRNGTYGTFRENVQDGQGWHFHRTNWITYKAAPEHTPIINGVNILNAGVDGSPGESYLVFDGLTVSVAGGGSKAAVYINRTGYVQILSCETSIEPESYSGLYAPYYWQNDNNVYIKSSHHITVQDCDIQGGGDLVYFAPEAGYDTYNITIQDCELHSSGSGGLNGGANWLTIDGCYIHDIHKFHCPILLTGTITGTFTKGDIVSQAGTGAHGIVCRVIGANRVDIWRTNANAFTKTGGTVTDETSGATLTSLTGYDDEHTDAIQFSWQDTHDVIIRNCRITRDDWGDAGLKLTADATDHYVTGVQIENNLIYAVKPILISNTKDCNIVNNTFVYSYDCLSDHEFYVNNGTTKRFITEVDNFYNNIIMDMRLETDIYDAYGFGYVWIKNHGNNIFGNNPNGEGGPLHPFIVNATERVNYDIDSLFVDANNGDYRLAPGSAAIDFGKPAHAPATDILGVSRGFSPDAGCYEYVGSGNQAPVLEEIGDKSVNENSLLTFDVNATDPNGDTITYSAQNLPSGATFANQNFSWTPGYDQAGSYQVTFIASDGQAQDSETITITVNNVNRAPLLGAIGSQSVNENSILSFSVSATDPDNDTITYSVESLPSGATFVSQTFTWTPGYNQAGTYPVTFTADDGQAQDSEAITITVINVNRAPVLSAIGDKSVYADDSLTFTVSATDPDGDTIIYSASNLPQGTNFDANSQEFSWTPSDSQVGSYEVTFIASDGQLQDSETVTIMVMVDTLAPSVTNCSPAADAIQVPLNNLIILHITDVGKGVDANSVTIEVDYNTVYSGNTAHYHSEYGHCRRIGTKTDYTFIYQADEMFDFDQTVSIAVNATDLAGNQMDEYSYSFKTEMRSFGEKKKLN